MCGINGILNRLPDPSLSANIRLMNARIIHRGPDDEGYEFFEDRLAMGMRRLSIIDIQHGHQPVVNSSGDISIVFNGELYNFRELRDELEGLGHTFNTSSDTEVVLKMYEHWGTNMFSKLNGMFAFSIHDKRIGNLIIARDRFGEKPLYYYYDDNRFAWASELKSLIAIDPELKKISSHSLGLYLTLTYIPAPYTIYEDVLKLEPGHYLKVGTTDLVLEKKCYWKTDIQPPERITDYSIAKKELRSLFFDSVEKRMIADVPLGVFLSGGVDSSIIAAVMSAISGKKINTFSVGYTNKRYDESERAQLAASHIGSVHHSAILNYADILDELDHIVLNYDEPYADSSALPTWFVSKHAAKHVKVALTGDGGDEVFGGYNKYLLHTYGKAYNDLTPSFIKKVLLKLTKSSLWKSSDTRSISSKLKKMIEATGKDTAANHLNAVSLGFKSLESERLLTNYTSTDLSQYIPVHTSNTDPLKLARDIDMSLSLEGDLLVKVDRASMLCSLECRAPFLDHRLVEFTNRIPDHFLIKGNNKKRILKDTFEDLLPSGFFNSPKSGFEIPVAHWFRNELKTDLLLTLSQERCAVHDLFNYSYISTLLTEHIERNIDHSYKLWTLYCFQKWYAANLASN